MREKKTMKKYMQIAFALCLYANASNGKTLTERLEFYGVPSKSEVCSGPMQDVDGKLQNCWLPYFDIAQNKVICKCPNFVYDKPNRQCVECPVGQMTLDGETCVKIVCPAGYHGRVVENGACPDGYHIKQITEPNMCTAEGSHLEQYNGSWSKYK